MGWMFTMDLDAPARDSDGRRGYAAHPQGKLMRYRLIQTPAGEMLAVISVPSKMRYSAPSPGAPSRRASALQRIPRIHG
jgi:hypothetical protein